MTDLQKRMDRLERLAKCRQHGVAIIRQISSGFLYKGKEYTPDGMERELVARGVDVVIVDDIPRCFPQQING